MDDELWEEFDNASEWDNRLMVATARVNAARAAIWTCPMDEKFTTALLNELSAAIEEVDALYAERSNTDNL